MTCDECKKLIGDYVDEEVAEGLCRELEAHLKECGSCTVEVDSLQKTIRIYRGSVPPSSLSDDAKRRLFAVLSFAYQDQKPAPGS